MSSPLGNPATRLHRLLKTAFGAPGHRGNLGARNMWAHAFGLDPAKDLHELLDAFASTVALPRHIRKAVENTPGMNEELHLRHLPAIEEAFSGLGLHSNRASYTTKVTDEVLTALEHTADALRTHGYVEREIDDDTLDDIREKVSTLIDDVLAADLDPEVREFALRHLSNLERAIRHIQAEGVGAVRDAVDSFLGEAFVRDKHAGNKKKGAWLRTDLGGRVLGVIGNVANIVGLIESGPQLVERVMGALPPGGP